MFVQLMKLKKKKKNKLKENMKTLEDLSLNLKETINELKIIFEKIENNKEELKIKIQKIFTKIRNQINDREDELLLDVDKKFKELYFNDDILKESEKLPDIIQASLERGKLINSNKDMILNSIINGCINIEKNINEINTINSSIQKFKSIQNKIEFIQNETETKFLLERINHFGEVYDNPLSQIINKDDFKKINEWIGGEHKFIIKYSAKKDGCNTDIFHEKCDCIGECIIICKINEGDIIGGYISTNIMKKDEFLYDDKAFLFNLSQNIIKKNKKNFNKAIKNFNDSSKFIKFGSDCNVFLLSGNCLNDKNSMVDTCSCQTNFSCENSNLLNKGSSQYFKVDDFEVFQLN